MKRRFLFGLMTTLAWTGVRLLAAPVDLGKEFTADEARDYYQVVETLNDKYRGVDLFWKLQDKYGVHEKYPARYVIGLIDASVLTKKVEQSNRKPPPSRGGQPRPAGAIDGAMIEHYFTVGDQKAALMGKAVEDNVTNLHEKYGVQPWYTATEVRDVQDNGKQAGALSAPLVVQPRPPAGWRPVANGLRFFKVRSDWTDLLAGEDLSYGDKINAKSSDDLVGASFSAAHDGQKHTDTVSAVGALLVPFTWHRATIYNAAAPALFSLVPSVSVNKVDTTGDASDEVDYVYYRLGAYQKWLLRTNLTGWTLQARESFVYATNTHGEGHLKAGELDLEPQVPILGRSEDGGPLFSLGFKNVVWPKEPVTEDATDTSLFDFQVRTWIHTELGQLQRNGAKWKTVDGSFFRSGPAVQLQLNFPEALRGISVTGKYVYLKPFHGPKPHNNYLKLATSFVLTKNEAAGQQMSLTFSIERGSLLLSKEYVDVSTAGLSIVY